VTMMNVTNAAATPTAKLTFGSMLSLPPMSAQAQSAGRPMPATGNFARLRKLLPSVPPPSGRP